MVQLMTTPLAVPWPSQLGGDRSAIASQLIIQPSAGGRPLLTGT